MDKIIIEVFKKDDLWCVVMGRDSNEGSFASGHTISEALRRLAKDLEAKDRGIIAAQRASLDGRGTPSDKAEVQRGLNPGSYT